MSTPEETRLARLAPRAIIGLEIWGDVVAAGARLAAALDGETPPVGRSTPLAHHWRLMGVEPRAWRLVGPLGGLEAKLARAETALGLEGAATDLTGSQVHLRLVGPRWREALMIGGVFDAEDPAFGQGATVATLLHQTPVRYDVFAPEGVDILVPPSFADDLADHLGAVLHRIAAMSAA